ncbi:hypothetical protein [Peterkaempfera bronchialis]|nr:hypothetical protein [Peterkaempfera bronchialis]
MSTLTAYRTEVTGEGQPYGGYDRMVSVVLGRHAAANRRLALR